MPAQQEIDSLLPLAEMVKMHRHRWWIVPVTSTSSQPRVATRRQRRMPKRKLRLQRRNGATKINIRCGFPTPLASRRKSAGSHGTPLPGRIRPRQTLCQEKMSGVTKIQDAKIEKRHAWTPMILSQR
jgi:hypothetical protein